MKNKYLILAAVAGFIIALDQWTKIYVHTNFTLGESVRVIKDFFNLTYVRNTGAAFGMFREAQETFRTIFFLSIPPVAVIIILFILKGLTDKDRLQIVALSSIFGGALGNYIDRLRFGYVIDFLDFHYKTFYTYPAFNVADSAIVGGVIVLMVIMFQQGRQEAKEKKAQSAT
ncbi:MAG: signal peptidase II [Bdellovibrionales bacterium]|nr:signal peptidase II [Bdellovibrionales bacterium]